MPGFEPEWLTARRPFDEAALDRPAIAAIRDWSLTRAGEAILLVDLGSGTGVALGRAASWLEGQAIEAFAVERDPALLAAFIEPRSSRRLSVVQLRADLLAPLEPLGGPADGTIDLVLGHAIADLLPLDRLADRVRALLRPGGLAHLALTYDGETAFGPIEDPMLEARVMAAYHRHMDRNRRADPAYGGSQAGGRLVAALRGAGLEIVRAAPSVWDVRPGGGHDDAARVVLERMLTFVVDSLLELGNPAAGEVRGWAAARQLLLKAGELRLRVRHLDVLARPVDGRDESR
jgi:SAM-dependent methyltransferase